MKKSYEFCLDLLAAQSTLELHASANKPLSAAEMLAMSKSILAATTFLRQTIEHAAMILSQGPQDQ